MTDPGRLNDDATPGTMPPPTDDRSVGPDATQEANQEQADQPVPGIPADEQSPQQFAPPNPAEPSAPKKKRTGLMIGLIGGGALVLALLVAGGVWFGLETTAHTPQAAAEPFMQALVKGDVQAAVKDGNIDTRSPLVTQAVYSKTTDRIDGFAIKPISTGATTAIVSVSYAQGANHHTETLHLVKSGTDMLFFTRWALAPVTLPTVKIAVDGPSSNGVQVNGTKVTVDHSGTTEVQALPGRYEATMASNPSYSAGDATANVTAIQATSTTSVDSLKLEVYFTDAGTKAANDAVNAWVAGCIAQSTLQPSGCSFGLTNDLPDIQLSNEKWTLVSAPKFTFGAWDGYGWVVQTTQDGSATFAADASDSAGDTGTVSSVSPVPVAVAGELTFDTSGKAVFRSIDWSGKASLPTA